MKAFEQERKQISVKVAASEEKIQALAAFDVIKAEAMAIESNEIAYFQQKYDDIAKQINETERMLSGSNFADKFFQ